MPIRPPAGTLTTTFDDTLRFYLNGTRVVLDEIDPEVTLLEYLRGIGLTGTKLYAHPLRLPQPSSPSTYR
jgi:xanthine dehydrogenase/oxidase